MSEELASGNDDIPSSYETRCRGSGKYVVYYLRPRGRFVGRRGDVCQDCGNEWATHFRSYPFRRVWFENGVKYVTVGFSCLRPGLQRWSDYMLNPQVFTTVRPPPVPEGLVKFYVAQALLRAKRGTIKLNAITGSNIARGIQFRLKKRGLVYADRLAARVKEEITKLSLTQRGVDL